MFKKLITNSLRPLGMIVFYAFAAWCILWSFAPREIGSDGLFNSLVDFTVSFESRFYDYRMVNQIDPKFKSKEIILVEIDDYSLEKLGMWPIPRTVHAKMIDKLRVFGAKVVALDILYPEQSPDAGKISPDKIFAESIKNFQQDKRKVFMSYTITSSPENSLKELPEAMYNNVLDSHAKNGNLIESYISKFTFPIDTFTNADVGLGFIDANEDGDGVFRQYRVMTNIDSLNFGSLGFNAVEAYMKSKLDILIDAAGADVQFNERVLKTNQIGETKLRYMARQNNFPTVSLYDLLEAPTTDVGMRDLFKDKLVFVGSTALGAHDLRPSPIGAQMPGVITHLVLAQMILSGHLFKKSEHSLYFSLALLSLGALLFLIVQRWGSAVFDALILVSLITASYYVDQQYLMPQGYEVKLFYCFFCFITCYSWNTLINFYQANKEKKQIRGTFARYVAPTIVDEMLKNPEKLQIGGQKMDITCLFSDVRDFTKISEGLSATELAHSMNTYMTKMTDIVFDTKGTLDKYIGDAIVAIWGAPLEIGNHAQYAVEGAIKMMEALPAVNDYFRSLGRPEFHVGIGLNSGECSVGNMGSARIFSYTALGDNMNLGARLESLCKHYGAHIIISEYTLARLDTSKMRIRPIDKVIVKGKTTAVSIYEVLYQQHPLAQRPELFEKFLKAHGLFLQKDFYPAIGLFAEILEVYPTDKSSKRFMDICLKYTQHPMDIPENFDITTMTEK